MISCIENSLFLYRKFPQSLPPRSPSGRYLPAGSPLPEEPSRMVSVEYPNLSGDAENAENPNQLAGVPRGARPAGESADRVQVRDMSFDVDTDDLNRFENENRLTNIAAENFRRFANGINIIMAFRLMSSEKIYNIKRVTAKKVVLFGRPLFWPRRDAVGARLWRGCPPM
jgi:hypothetical protein